MKNILVCSTGSDTDDVRFGTAERLAEACGSRLTILAGRLEAPARAATPALVPGAVGIAVPDAVSEPAAQEEVSARLSRIKQRFGGKDNIRIEALEGGSMAEAAVHSARTKDLVVASTRETDSASIAEAILADTTTPVLLVSGGDSGTSFSRACIAWNDSPACARAVKGAMPLLEAAEEAVIVTVDRLRPAGRDPVNKTAIERHLDAHGVKNRCVPVASGDLTTAEAIVAEAERVGADFLVAGASMGSAFMDWLKGSTTRKLIAKAPIPVLLGG